MAGTVMDWINQTFTAEKYAIVVLASSTIMGCVQPVQLGNTMELLGHIHALDVMLENTVTVVLQVVPSVDQEFLSVHPINIFKIVAEAQLESV